MEGYDCVNGAGLLFVPRGAPLPPQLLPAAPAVPALLRAALRWLGSYQLATLTAGCFWGARWRLGALPGVLWAVAGYCGGGGAAAERPSYAQVCGGGTGHLEAVQLAYDPGAISFDEILEAFWAAHEPTSARCDRAPTWGRSTVARSSTTPTRSGAPHSSPRAALQSALPGGAQVVRGVRPAGVFFEAEAGHQAKG